MKICGIWLVLNIQPLYWFSAAFPHPRPVLGPLAANKKGEGGGGVRQTVLDCVLARGAYYSIVPGLDRTLTHLKAVVLIGPPTVYL